MEIIIIQNIKDQSESQVQIEQSLSMEKAHCTMQNVTDSDPGTTTTATSCGQRTEGKQ